MTDRSPIWIGLADLLLCVVSVVIVAVNPHARSDAVPQKAEYLLTSDWSVDVDADVDVWLVPPSKKPVMFASRDGGCAKLDSDTRGFMDSIIHLADGSTVKVLTNKETVSLRCIEPGRYDLAVNLYAYRTDGQSAEGKHGLSLPVEVEVIGVNPSVHTVYQHRVVLDHVGDTVNVVSFDLAPDGSLRLVDPPLRPVTDDYLSNGSLRAHRP